MISLLVSFDCFVAGIEWLPVPVWTILWVKMIVSLGIVAVFGTRNSNPFDYPSLWRDDAWC